MIDCDGCLELRALPGIPVVMPGDRLEALVETALVRSGIVLKDGDVIVVASKVVSRSEGRFVDLSTVVPGVEALSLGTETDKDPRLVELILRESNEVSRKAKGALVVRHRLGFVTADAGIDLSNAGPPDAANGTGPFALLLPSDPDRTADTLRRALAQRHLANFGVIISDSFGRPFRLGTVGVAIGVAGIPALWNQRGRVDLFGRALERTVVALADQVAAAADLVAGQADEGRPVVHVRGLRFPVSDARASELLRPTVSDLYA